MKKFKKFSLIITAALAIFILGGCGNSNRESENGSNFVVRYDAENGVDKVRCVIDGIEIGLEPMFDADKVEKGGTLNAVLPEDSKGEFLIEIIDDGKLVYEQKDFKVDLSDGKKAEVLIIQNGDGNFDVKVENK